MSGPPSSETQASAPHRDFVVAAEAESSAPPAQLWAMLVDLPGLSRWNPFTPWILGTLAPGRLVLIWARIGPLLVPALNRVETVETERELAWATTWPLGLLAARRVQRLEARDDGGCVYHSQERFTGLLAPVVQRLVGRRLQHGFDTTAQALARTAEARTAEARTAEARTASPLERP